MNIFEKYTGVMILHVKGYWIYSFTEYQNNPKSSFCFSFFFVKKSLQNKVCEKTELSMN